MASKLLSTASLSSRLSPVSPLSILRHFSAMSIRPNAGKRVSNVAQFVQASHAWIDKWAVSLLTCTHRRSASVPYQCNFNVGGVWFFWYKDRDLESVPNLDKCVTRWSILRPTPSPSSGGRTRRTVSSGSGSSPRSRSTASATWMPSSSWWPRRPGQRFAVKVFIFSHLSWLILF